MRFSAEIQVPYMFKGHNMGFEMDNMGMSLYMSI